MNHADLPDIHSAQLPLNKALHFIAKFKHNLKDCKGYDIPQTVQLLTDDERKRLRLLINEIDAIHDQIMTRI